MFKKQPCVCVYLTHHTPKFFLSFPPLLIRVYEPISAAQISIVLMYAGVCVAPHLNVVEIVPPMYYDGIEVNLLLCTIKTGGECTLTCSKK